MNIFQDDCDIRQALRSDLPLRFPVPAFVPTASYAGMPIEKISQNSVDARRADDIHLVQLPAIKPAETLPAIKPAIIRSSMMTLTLKTLSKNGKNAYYVGAAATLRFNLAAFPGKTAPASIEVADGAFAPAKQPKAKLTAAVKMLEGAA